MREFLALAIPLASAQVAQSATGFADTVMMGRMGPEILGAGGLAAIVFLSIVTAVGALVTGMSPLIAEAFGAGESHRVRQVARQGLWLTLLISLPTMGFTANLEKFMAIAGQSESTIEIAATYLDIMAWGVVPVVGFTALRSIVSALSMARPVMAIVVTGTVCNVLGNYVLGFGKWGFPRMGIAGLAIASVLAWWGMFFALALYLAFDRRAREYRIFRGFPRFQPRILGELTRIGLPIALATALETGFFTALALLMGLLGTEVLAAHQVVFQTIALVFMIPLGISFATTVRVGQWLGKRDFRGVRRAVQVSAGCTIAVMVGISIFFLLFPKAIIGIYLDAGDPENAPIIAIALPLFSIAAIAQILDGLQKALYGSLQGLQDTRVPMLLNVVGWGAGLSVGYFLAFIHGMGGAGLWIGQSVATASVAGLFLWRLRWHGDRLPAILPPR
jgi:MATE family multidrug resistance protein